MLRNIGTNNNSNLLVKVDHVEKDRSSFKFYS